MTAHKCDRCGKFYLRNERYHPHSAKNCAIEGISTLQLYGKKQYFELCDECLEEFFEVYMKGSEAECD